MSNYTKTTDFEAKDSLPSGDSGKIIRGSEFETEFDNIATAIATKADAASPTFTGTVTIDGLTVNGNTTLGNAATDTVTVTADIASNLIPSADDTYNLGASGAEWNDLFIDGTANIDSLVAGSGSFTSISTTGNVTFGDNDKAVFGAGSDLEIYHNGNNSFISDTGTGSLYVRASDSLRIQTATNEEMIKAEANGAVTLYNDNSTKLATTSTGIDVTGTVTADGLTVDGTIEADGTFNPTTSGWVNASFKGTGSYGGGIAFVDGTAGFANYVLSSGTAYRIGQGSTSGALTTHFQINNSGDISFYEDTGTTAKFFWDASAERLGIGTTSPSRPLHVNDNDGIRVGTTASYQLDLKGAQTPAVTVGGSTLASVITTSGTGSASGHIGFEIPSNDANDGFYIATDANNDGTVDTLAMKIDASGNVGIGTSSPAKLLDVSSDSSPTVRISNTRNDTGWDVDPVFGALEFYSADTSGSGASVRASLTAEAASSFGNATNFIFRNGDSLGVQQENMRLDYRGYLGIGVTNPYTTFHVNSDTLNEVARFESGDATAYISLQDNTTSNDLHGIGATGDVLQLFSNNAERVRIDSSGNLLVGKTSVDTFTTVGHELHEDGLLVSTRDSGNVAVLNRETNDGSILQFRKDNTTVGSIGATSDDLYVGTGDTTLRFFDSGNAILPRGTGGAANDGVIDLGNSTNRFKDLYLSGGAYLGGTAAANHLDDYEEGTFTPAFSATGLSVTYDQQAGKYTKVGNIVHFLIQLGTDAATGTSASETLTIAGLPFSAGGQNSSGSLGFVYSTAVDISNMRYSIGVGNTYITLYDGGDTTGFAQTHSDILADGVNKNRIFIAGFYYTGE